MTKKSRRHRTVTASAPAPAAPPPARHPLIASDAPATARCSHGIAPFASEAEAVAYFDAVKSLCVAADTAVKVEGGGMATQMKVVDNWLLSHPQLDPKRVIKTLLWANTENLLALDSATKTKKEKDDVFDSCRAHGTLILDFSEISLQKRECTGSAILSIAEERAKLLSIAEERAKLYDCDKEAVRFFDKRITCACLEPLLAVASSKESPYETCWGCNVFAGEVAGQKLLLCSGCNIFKFCSKECQLKHWARHKPFCREIRKHREKEVVLVD